MRKLAALLVLWLASSGCSGGDTTAVDSTEFVCDDFARYAQDGQPRDQRSEVVSGIGDLIGNADAGVREAYPVLTRSVDAPDTQWELAADTFAQSCFDAGWDG